MSLETIIVDIPDTDNDGNTQVYVADGNDIFLCWKCKKAFTVLTDFLIHKQSLCEGDDDGTDQTELSVSDPWSSLTLNIQRSEPSQETIITEIKQPEAEKVQEPPNITLTPQHDAGLPPVTAKSLGNDVRLFTPEGQEINISAFANEIVQDEETFEIPSEVHIGYDILQETPVEIPISCSGSTEPIQEKTQIGPTERTLILSTDKILENLQSETSILSPTSEIIPVIITKDVDAPALTETIQEICLEDDLANQVMQQQYMCSVCGARYLEEIACLEHMKVHVDEVHPDVNNASLQEETKNKAGKRRKKKSLDALQDRNSLDEVDTSLLTGVLNESFKCNVCGQICISAVKLKQHMKSHTDENSLECQPLWTGALNINESFKCNLCGRICISAFKLKQHMKIHTDHKPFECQICSKKHRTASHLKSHMFTHSKERTQKCPHCDKSYKTANDLAYHKKVKHGYVKPYKCPACPKRYYEQSDFIDHLKVHTADVPYQCEICNKTFSSTANLKTHKTVHTGEKLKECNLCDKKFRYQYDYILHTRKVHTGEQPFQCDQCDEKFYTSRHLRIHQGIHDGTAKNYCSICDEKFKYAYLFELHNEMKHMEKPYKCEVCLKAFTRESYLKEHNCCIVDSMNVKPYVCQICNEGFDDSTDFLTHCNSHSNPDTFVCECRKKFSSKESLDVHKIMHKEDKPYKCEKCGKEFKEGHKYKRHAVFNCKLECDKVEPKFTCTVCPKSFYSAYHQSKHQETHLEVREKPFTCEICNKKVSNLSLFKRHMMGHTEETNTPYMCDICGKAFKFSDVCRKHKAKHFDGKTFSCKICNNLFGRKSELINHHNSHPEVGIYVCRLCDVSSTNLDECIKHNEDHQDQADNDRPFLCNICEYVYNNLALLQAHLYICNKDEEKEFPVKCRDCDYRCKSRKTLLFHRRLHHSVKFFRCKVCGNELASWTSYCEHLKEHGDENFFECSYCNKSFTNHEKYVAHVLKKHELKISTEDHQNVDFKIEKDPDSGQDIYKCYNCDAVFQELEHAILHEKSHNTDLTCTYCSVTYATKKTLMKHIRTVHHMSLTHMSNKVIPELNKNEKAIGDEPVLNIIVANTGEDGNKHTGNHDGMMTRETSADKIGDKTAIGGSVMTTETCVDLFGHKEVINGDSAMTVEASKLGQVDLEAVTNSDSLVNETSKQIQVFLEVEDDRQRNLNEMQLVDTTPTDTLDSVQEAVRSPQIKFSDICKLKEVSFEGISGMPSNDTSFDLQNVMNDTIEAVKMNKNMLVILGHADDDKKKEAVHMKTKQRRLRIAECEICSVKLASRHSLVKHLQEEHCGDERAALLMPEGFDCDLCDKRYCNKYELLKHMVNKHPDESIPQALGSGEFICDVCEKKCISRVSLLRHIKEKHADVKKITREEYHCNRCDKVFYTPGGLRKHLFTAHGISPSIRYPGLTKGYIKNSGSLECPVCKKKYSWRRGLRKHIMDKHPADYDEYISSRKYARFHCSACPKVFTMKMEFDRHAEMDHPGMEVTFNSINKSYICNICDKNFNNQQRYKKHVITHEKSQDVMCNICFSMHKRPDTLKKHMQKYHPEYFSSNLKVEPKDTDEEIVDENEKRVHTTNISREFENTAGKKNEFKCTICGISFARQSMLQRHLNKTHVKDCPYICSYCARGFCTLEACMNHEARHKTVSVNIDENTASVNKVKTEESSDDMPIECLICKNSFIGKVNFKKHLDLAHHKECLDKCELCGRGFLNLQSHKKNCEKFERNFLCVICNRKYVTNKSLAKHLKQKHPTHHAESKHKRRSASNREGKGIKDVKSRLVDELIDSINSGNDTDSQSSDNDSVKLVFDDESDFEENSSFSDYGDDKDDKENNQTFKFVELPGTSGNEQGSNPNCNFQCLLCSREFLSNRLFKRHMAFHEKTSVGKYSPSKKIFNVEEPSPLPSPKKKLKPQAKTGVKEQVKMNALSETDLVSGPFIVDSMSSKIQKQQDTAEISLLKTSRQNCLNQTSNSLENDPKSERNITKYSDQEVSSELNNEDNSELLEVMEIVDGGDVITVEDKNSQRLEKTNSKSQTSKKSLAKKSGEFFQNWIESEKEPNLKTQQQNNVENISKSTCGNSPRVMYQCEECNEKFSTIGSLNKHCNLEHPSLSAVCGNCKEEFKTQSGLRRHIKHCQQTSNEPKSSHSRKQQLDIKPNGMLTQTSASNSAKKASGSNKISSQKEQNTPKSCTKKRHLETFPSIRANNSNVPKNLKQCYVKLHKVDLTEVKRKREESPPASKLKNVYNSNSNAGSAKTTLTRVSKTGKC